MIPPLTQRLRDGWMDPLRRRNSLARIAESYLPSLCVLVAVGQGWRALGWAAAITFLEFVLYEFVLEPLGWIGPYWERGPRDGETFTRG